MTDIVDPVVEAYAVDHTSPPPAHLVAVDRDTCRSWTFRA